MNFTFNSLKRMNIHLEKRILLCNNRLNQTNKGGSIMKRLPKGTLTPLAEKTGIKPDYLSALVTGNKRPSRKRAQKLEQASQISAAVWLLSSKEELREAVLGMKV